MSFTSFMLRWICRKNDTKRDAGLTTPQDILRYDNILYGGSEKWQVLDVYRPAGSGDDALPVIISVHGGGWVYGDKERYQYYCMNLAQRGFAVVNFTYRLAPKYKFPAPVEDTNLVCAWVMQNAAGYHFDTGSIFGVGDSAGAQILGLHAAVCTNGDFAKQFAFKAPEGFRWRAIALNCGQYSIPAPDQMDHTTKDLMRDYLPGGGTADELAKANVISHITKDFPPAFVMTANQDFLKTQAPILTAKLSEVGAAYTYQLYGDESNPLQHVFHYNMRSDDARICNDDECAFFRTFCTAPQYRPAAPAGGNSDSI